METSLGNDTSFIPDIQESDSSNSSCLLCHETRSLTRSAASFMVQCDVCDNWFHGVCASIMHQDAADLLVFHCPTCTPMHGESTWQTRRKSERSKKPLYGSTYSELNEGIVKPEVTRWKNALESRLFDKDEFPRMPGSLLMDFIERNGFTTPIFVLNKEGLGIAMPSSNLTVWQIAQLVGEDLPLEGVDVATQSESHEFTLGSFAEYFHSSSETPRTHVVNVLSLEVSNTALGKQIIRPNLVRHLDWATNVWPSSAQDRGEWPQVQLYCLMSIAGCYTDFHIDFGGSSVFYHVLSGAKTFYFIPPTDDNLRRYEQWMRSVEQSVVFFADRTKTCFECKVNPGETMFIPAGWIHAVYTPVDSIVIGGNFIHGLGVEMQWRIYEIEDKTGVPPKFRFPYYIELNWYAANHYLLELDKEETNVEIEKKGSQFSERELKNILDLAKRLSRNGMSNSHLVPRELQPIAKQILRDLMRLTLSRLCYPINLMDEEIKEMETAMSGAPDMGLSLAKFPAGIDDRKLVGENINDEIASVKQPDEEEIVSYDLSHLADTDRVDDAILRDILGSSSEDEAVEREKEEEQDTEYAQNVDEDDEEEETEDEDERDIDELSEDAFETIEDEEDDDIINDDDDDGELDSEDERNIKKRVTRKRDTTELAIKSLPVTHRQSVKKRRLYNTVPLDKKSKKKSAVPEDRSAPSEVSSADMGICKVPERPLRTGIAMRKTRTEIIDNSGDDFEELAQTTQSNSPVRENASLPVIAVSVDVTHPAALPQLPKLVAQPRSLASLLSTSKTMKYSTKRR